MLGENYRGGSPYSDVASEVGRESVSLHQQALLRRHVQNQNGSNPRMGYISFNESYTGLRGHKTYILWAIVGVLLVAALANLLLTCVLMGVLRISYGMKSLEFVDVNGHGGLKFYGDVDLNEVIQMDGMLSSFKGEGLSVEGDSSSIVLKLSDQKEKIEINQEGIVVEGIDSFQVIDPDTGKKVFATDYSQFGLPSGVRQLDVAKVQTHRVASPLHEPLQVKSSSQIRVKGNEGTYFKGKSVMWRASDDVYLKSVNGSIILEAKEGIFLDVSKLGLEGTNSQWQHPRYHAQYKLCVCMPNGKLFRMSVSDPNVGCNHAGLINNKHPCSLEK